jgi:hypothetical protein
MTIAKELRSNFTAGELSDTIDTRTSFERYFNGSSILENFIIKPQGSLVRRKGSKYINEVKDSTKKTALIPFQFSASQTYVIEIGNQYMRFFSQQGQVLDGSNNILEISTVFLESEIFNNKGELVIRFVQDADVMYLLHPNHPIQKLIRVSATSFNISSVELLKGPLMDQNLDTSKTIAKTAGNNSVGNTTTLTATGHTPFQSGHVGSIWTLKKNNDIAYFKITAFTSSTVISAEVLYNDVPSSIHSLSTYEWREGEFSDVRGYPSAMAIHEQRLVLAGTTLSPQKIFFSQIGDYENFEEGTNDSESFTVKIASQSGDPIRWLFSDQVLYAGTTGGIFRIRNSSNSSSITPTDIDIKKHISHGCNSVNPELLGDVPLYMQKGGKIARAITFNFDVDKYTTNDLTIDADHVTGTGISHFAYQQTPFNAIYSVRKDGQCCVMFFERQQDVRGWGRFKTDGNIKSISVINGVTKQYVEVCDLNYDNTTINRFYVDSGLSYDGTKTGTLTISGNNATASVASFSNSDINKQIHEFATGTGKATITGYTSSTQVTINIIEPFSSNSISSWSIALKTVTGLNHLEGKEVDIAGDDTTQPKQTVSSGAVNLSKFSRIIHVGLNYESIQQSMPLEALTLRNTVGSSQHKLTKITKVSITFSETLGGLVNNSAIFSKTFNDNMNEASPLINEDREVLIKSSYNSNSFVKIKQNEPQPMTIKSVTYKFNVNDL